MTIEWYPGHMVAAKNEIAEAMSSIDVVIEVLDARVPESSSNPQMEALRKKRQKPALKVLNKSDLADPEGTAKWLAFYNAQKDTKAIAVTAQKEAQKIPQACKQIIPTKGTKTKPLRMMIMGIPNVGKSTLMNALLKRHISKVGDEPAVTKQTARHALGDGMWLTDTPGMMWPKLAQSVAIKLAACNNIGRNAYDEAEVAMSLADMLLPRYSPLLEKRYGGAYGGHAMLEHIAKVRSLVVKGGEPDLAKAAMALLNDFRNGVLGRMTLDTW